MFLFKNKKVVVDCFTTVGAIAREYPIKKSSHYVPKWWQDLENVKHHSTDVGIDRPYSTMKSCSGFVHLFRNSWTIPLWSDFKIKTFDDGSWVYVTPQSLENQIHSKSAIQKHFPDQFSDAFENYTHLKFASPWLLYEKTAVHFAMVSADWTLISKLPDFRIPVGFLNFKYSMAPNINLFVTKKNFLYELEAGTPMVYLIPITEKKVDFKTQVISESEYQKIVSKSIGFTNKFSRGVVKWD